MVDMDWKAKMASSNISTCKSPKLSSPKPHNISLPKFTDPSSPSPSSSSTSCLAYEQYIHLPQLTNLWNTKNFPNWKNESLIKPSLQALEITFRFISLILSDPRPYVNRNEWKRRLDSLTTHQVQLIGLLCEDDSEDGDTRGRAPIVDLSSSNGLISREGKSRKSSAEVWKVPEGSGNSCVVSRISEASLLPRLGTWHKSEEIASKIMFSIECEMRRCPYTLGLGEPNLSGKPNLEYDLICQPSDLHRLKSSNLENNGNLENQSLFTTHQILESWIHVSRGLLGRIEERINGQDFEKAANDCWLLERIWKLMAEIEDLHLLTDPDDFLRLKNQLSISSSSPSEPFGFRSRGLMEISRLSKDLKHKVPSILAVEVDPLGGPRIQEAAMKLYHNHQDIGKIHLLQGFQAVESGLKKFYFSYRQLIAVVMGSLEANGNRNIVSGDLADEKDVLCMMYSEPTYFPSLDAAKTFLEDFWHGATTKSN